jgi:bifunctional non-homologous end joining protein LigD
VLLSWAVPKGIPDDPKRNHLAVRTEDHPLEYVDFHGEIPAGQYGAGQMIIWDKGTYDAEKLRDDEVIATFSGERMTGRYALFQTDGKNWMIHRMDPPVRPDHQPPPRDLRPMLAVAGELPRDETGWAFEIKWDGVRALARWEPGDWSLWSRNGTDLGRQFPELRALGDELAGRDVLLDGEIVALDEAGHPSFQQLQRRLGVKPSVAARLAREVPATLVIFDLLHLEGESLLNLPWTERRARLDALAPSGPNWRTPPAHLSDGATLLAAAGELGLEGIMAKQTDSLYLPGRRSQAWRKVKLRRRQEFVIGAWMPGESGRAGSLGSLAVGYYQDGELRYAGRVGSGIGPAEARRLLEQLEPLARKTSPFTAGRKPPKEAQFVEPRLVCEVEFREWTSVGMLRQPVYLGLREDRDPKEVVREPDVIADPSDAAAGGSADGSIVIERSLGRGAEQARAFGRELRLTNRTKVLYPAANFTKGDVIDYYAAIAETLVPHLTGRPLTLTRSPDGVDSQGFFEKRAPPHRPDWVATIDVDGTPYLDAREPATIVWLANLAALELHPSLARAPRLDHPTQIVFDLDPGAGVDVLGCAAIAVEVRTVLQAAGLEPLIKTSGSKGLHVLAPLDGSATFEESKTFAQAVAELLVRQHPDRVVARQTKSLRKGRVLVDWSQNTKSKTTIAVYSLRARERPTVSTPIGWDELQSALDADDAARLVFEAPAVLERVRAHGDLFAAAAEPGAPLPAFGRRG